ncbi:MAG: hypothetical protein BalsKO_02660 [Balneolaceae bacterium]
MFSKIILSTLIIPLVFHFTNTPNYSSKHSINAIIGDVSFVDTFDRLPNQEDSEVLRITTHLNYVIGVLELTSTEYLSETQSLKRSKLISILNEYVKEERFPKNYDFEDQRRPTFIDKDGNICAVGYLVQQTVGQEAAEAINKKYKYEYLMEMESELLDSWLNEYGLTKKEAAMIQPSYGSIVVEKENKNVNKIDKEYALTSSILLGTQAAFTSLTLNPASNTSPKTKTIFSALNTGLGLASIVTGIINLDENTNTFDVSLDDGSSIIMFTPVKRVTEINQSNINLSILNIAFGTFSAMFNGYRFFKFKEESTFSKLTLNSTIQYTSQNSEPIPSLNLSLSF